MKAKLNSILNWKGVKHLLWLLVREKMGKNKIKISCLEKTYQFYRQKSQRENYNSNIL